MGIACVAGSLCRGDCTGYDPRRKPTWRAVFGALRCRVRDRLSAVLQFAVLACQKAGGHQTGRSKLFEVSRVFEAFSSEGYAWLSWVSTVQILCDVLFIDDLCLSVLYRLCVCLPRWQKTAASSCLTCECEAFARFYEKENMKFLYLVGFFFCLLAFGILSRKE